MDSEELAARLAAAGFQLVAEPAAAQTLVVNTCGFIEAAKKDSIDTLLAAAEFKQHDAQAVVAVGCLAERYGAELAEALPEADAVLGFDDYPDIAQRLRDVLAGSPPPARPPTDRRKLLPLTPARRPTASQAISVPGHGQGPAAGPRTWRKRLNNAPTSPLKIASGCDRRCAFCAIPTFRGSFVSRPSADIVAEAELLAADGVKEVLLVSENSSSYGKDLAEERLETLLPQLAAVPGLEWIRVSYLQPAEIRPSLLEVMLGTDKVVPYFDLSFQHASPTVLRRMRRFGDPASFLDLIQRIRDAVPTAGIRSNVIVGFPGETEADVELLREFVQAARLDVLGVFAYSDEEGTEGYELPDHVDPEEVQQRHRLLQDVALEVCEQRAADRIGEETTVLVETSGAHPAGRARHQAPETDGITIIEAQSKLDVGQLILARIVECDGIDVKVVPT